jgi:membrane associated rhomboid family serine protease
MGIQSRDYYREWRPSAGALIGTPVVKYLIIVNVIVFVLQLISVQDIRVSPLERLKKHDPERFKNFTEEDIPPEYYDTRRVSIVQEWFQLDADKTIYHGQVWRLLTHAFCHDRTNPLHIVINMLCLYWFGVTIELKYGSREFLYFYLTAAVFAGLAYVGLNLLTGALNPAIGASGAVMAVMMVYTMHYPGQIIYLFFFIPLQIRWAMVLFVAYDLYPTLQSLAGVQVFTGIAHAAHLGGALFGFLYVHFHWRLTSLGGGMTMPRWRRKPRLRIVRVDERRPQPEPEPAASSSRRLDEVLAKISRSGQGSLTDEEREILHRESDRLKNRRRD